jgi:hypothetical protein
MAHLGEGGRQGRGYVRSLGAPSPDVLVRSAGDDQAGITPVMHAFWKIEDPQMQQIQSAMFFKNAALLGAA